MPSSISICTGNPRSGELPSLRRRLHPWSRAGSNTRSRQSHQWIQPNRNATIPHTYTDSLGALQSLKSENPTSWPIQIANIKVSTSAAMENGVEIKQTHGNQTEWDCRRLRQISNNPKRRRSLHKSLNDGIQKSRGETRVSPRDFALMYIKAKWQQLWDEDTTGREYHTMEPAVSKASKFRHNDREMEKTLTRLRLRKCYLNSYMHKIRRHRDGMCDTCGNPETVEHYLKKCGGNQDIIYQLEV